MGKEKTDPKSRLFRPGNRQIFPVLPFRRTINRVFYVKYRPIFPIQPFISLKRPNVSTSCGSYVHIGSNPNDKYDITEQNSYLRA